MKRIRDPRKPQRAITLVELLVVLVLIVIMSAAVTSAFVAAIDTEQTYARRRQQDLGQSTLEAKLKQLVQGAILSENTADTTSYFVGEFGNAGTSAQSTSTGANGAPTLGSSGSSSSSSSGSNSTNSGQDLGCDRLTFTTTAPDVPLATQNNSTDDFETQHQANGPVGGVAEISISTTAVGDAGDRTGVFERIQRPSDADATQGGTESLLNAQIQGMGFQFWDGAQWQDTWDSTTTPDTGRLPAAVMVSYTIVGDPTSTIHELLIPVPASNVTTANPIVDTSGTTP